MGRFTPLHRQPVDYAGPSYVTIDECERRLRGDHYALLLDCYLSGQIPEAAWQEHLQDLGLRRWLEERVHVSTGERGAASRLVGAFALALVVFVAIYFAGQLLRGVL